jgi:hypothetical protein
VRATAVIVVFALLPSCAGGGNAADDDPAPPLPVETYWQVSATDSCADLSAPATSVFPMRLQTSVNWLTWDVYASAGTRFTGKPLTHASFRLTPDYPQKGVLHGRFAADGQSFRATSVVDGACSYWTGRRYPGPGVCQVWPDDAKRRLEIAVTQAATTDAVLADWFSFWHAFAGRFAGKSKLAHGEYAWNGKAWAVVTGATLTGWDYAFDFEDGSRLRAVKSSGVVTLRFTHAAGWEYRSVDLADGASYAETGWDFDGRWGRRDTSAYYLTYAPFFTSRHDDGGVTIDVSAAGQELHAQFPRAGGARVSYNGAVTTLTERELNRLCPFLLGDLVELAPQPEDVVGAAELYRAYSFLYPSGVMKPL